MRQQTQPHFSQDRELCPRCKGYHFLAQPIIYPRSYARHKILNGVAFICHSCNGVLEYLVLETEARHRKKPMTEEDYREVSKSFFKC